MRRLRGTILVLASAGVAAGCAYFNGLYNARRLVKEAGRAEREGRVAEAHALYSEAAVKAESVAVRYPESEYRDDAVLLQGLAFRASGQCVRARAPLEDVLSTSADSGLRRQARLALGECLVEVQDLEVAAAVLAPLTSSADPELASRARLWRGRALLALQLYDAAVLDLEASQLAAADFDLAIAYASIDQPNAAGRTLARHGGEFEEPRWLAALDSLGKRYPDAASMQVELLIARPDLTPGQRSRLLLADGERWLRSDRPRTAVDRFERAASVAPESAAWRAARRRQVAAELRVVDQVGALASLAEAIQPASGGLATAADDAGLASQLERVVRALESDSLLEHPELELFLAAERFRDGLRAPAVAAAVFREVATRYPTSPIAPKALLAAVPLVPRETADSLIDVLHRRYADSPYTLALAGQGGDAYRRLEDSLRSLAATRRDPRR